MKKFTDTQKKWALTATMIAALGCSVSFNPHVEGYAALDMASKSSDVVTDKFTLDDKELKVHYIKKGKDQITAVVTGGSDCDVCNTYVIDKKLKTDAKSLADIQVELVAQIADRHGEESDSEDEVKEEKLTRAELRRRAEKESYSSDKRRTREKLVLSKSEQMDLLYEEGDKACLSNGRAKYRALEQSGCYARAMSTSLERHEDISQEIAVRYYRENIEENLVLGVSKFSAMDPYAANDSFDIMEEMMNSIPPEHRALREQITFASAKAVNMKAQELKIAVQTSGSREAALYKQTELLQLTGYAGQTTFDTLVRSGLTIPEATYLYNTAFATPVTQVYSSIPTINSNGAITAPNYSSTNLNAPNSFNLNGSPVLNDNQALIDRLAASRGAVPAPGLSAVDELQKLQVQQLQQQNSQGLQWGSPTAVSPQTQILLQQLHSSPNYYRAQ